MKKRRALLMLVLSSLVLSGCWDRREINDVAFVMATGIDKDPSGKYRVTVQVPLPSQLGGIGSSGGGGGTSGGKSYFDDSAVADTIREANEIQQRSMSRQIYFAHRRVVIVGEELAKEGLDPLMDVISRIPQNRLTSFLVIAGGTARDIMTADAPTEQFPAEIMRELAQGSMKRPRTIKHLINMMVEDGADISIPFLEMNETKPGNGGKTYRDITNAGLAVFKHSRLVGVLRGDEGNAVLLAMNQARHPVFTVPTPDKSGKVSIILQENSATLKPKIEGKNLSVTIEIKGKGYVVEDATTYNLASDNNLAKVSYGVADQIRKTVLASVDKLQNQYQADPIGIGDAIYRSYPQEWKELRKDWASHYKDVKVEVNALVHLEHSGTFTAPIGRKKGVLTE